jgi:hypothetical protein
MQFCTNPHEAIAQLFAPLGEKHLKPNARKDVESQSPDRKSDKDINRLIFRKALKPL